MDRRDSARSAAAFTSDSDAPRRGTARSSRGGSREERDSPIVRGSGRSTLVSHREREHLSLSSSAAVAASSSSSSPSARRSHQSRIPARVSSRTREEQAVDTLADAEAAEDYKAEVSLVARVVASLVLKWREHVEHGQDRQTYTGSPSTVHRARGPLDGGEVVVAAGSKVVPSTRWIAKLNAWETEVRHAARGELVRTRSASDRAERARGDCQYRAADYSPLPVEVLEGIVDSAEVVLRGMEKIDREQQRRMALLEELEAELHRAKKENRRLRAQLAMTSPRSRSNSAEKKKDTKASQPVRSSAQVDPVLAKMIAEAARATLHTHFNQQQQHASNRVAIADPVAPKPPLAGAVPVLVPTKWIPPQPYSSPPRTVAKVEDATANTTTTEAAAEAAAAPTTMYTPPSALRGRSEEGSPTILSPLTEVYSLSDPQTSQRKPSRSPHSPRREGESSLKKNKSCQREEAEVEEEKKARDAARAEQEAYIQELREAYEEEVHAVEAAQRRLTALSSTVDVLRAQLALADDQRELEIEEARLCVVAQQTLLEEEEAARWSLVVDSLSEHQTAVQRWARLLPKGNASASTVLPSPSVPTSSTPSGLGVGKRLRFVPAVRAADVPANAQKPRSAVLFTKAPTTATAVVATTMPSNSADAAAHGRASSSDPSLSSVSDGDVRVPRPAEPSQHPAEKAGTPRSGLPARRLPTRATPAVRAEEEEDAKATVVRAAPSSAQTSPILRRRRPEEDREAFIAEASLSVPPPFAVNETARPIVVAELFDVESGHARSPRSEPQRLVSPLRGLEDWPSPSREVQLPDESPIVNWSPSAHGDIPRPALSTQQEPQHYHLKPPPRDNNSDDERESMGELQWQRAKQAVRVDNLRRDSQSRRRSQAAEIDNASGGSAPRGLASPSANERPTGAQTAATTASTSSSAQQMTAPVVVISPPRHAQPMVAAPSQTTARPLFSSAPPQNVDRDDRQAACSTPTAEVEVDAVVRSRAPIAAEYRSRFSPNRSHGSETSPVRVLPSSASPPVERTPKSIARYDYYAEPLEELEGSRSASKDKGDVDVTRQHAHGDASPPPRAPPTVALFSSSALAARGGPQINAKRT